MVGEFHENATLWFISTFIALIPKRSNPQEIKDFRPITLIGCLYKIISKILANRLNKVLTSVVSLNQSAFLSNRQILDDVLMVNEVVDLVKK